MDSSSKLYPPMSQHDSEKTIDHADHKRTLLAKAKRARAARASLCRHDPNEFCTFVLRDERTGAKIEQAPMHQRWQELITLHDRLVIWSHVEGGKTNQIAVGRTLFELGRDPNLRVAVVSNTSDLAKKMTRQIGQYIQKSAELREVFPHLMPTKDPALPWKAQALTVQRAGIGGKDPTVQACGVHGNIQGSRIDLLILDDVLDYENTRTPAPREDIWRWVKSTLFSRLTSHARVIVVGNAWHPEDLLHRLEKEPGFFGFRFPVVDPEGGLTWPSRWPHTRVEKAREDMGPLEFARQLLCQARDDTSARIKREWIDRCIKLGEGLPFIESLDELADESGLVEELPESELSEAHRARIEQLRMEAAAAETIWRLSGDARIYTGVDLAVQRHDAADQTVLFTILVDEAGVRRVLNIESGRWAGPEIIDHIKSVYDRFGGIFVVENNAAQDYIVQFLHGTTSVPVIPFTTGRNKAHPEFGVESLGAEFAAGKWLIPNSGGKLHREVGEWVQELLFYDPREHTGDRVMASWFAREGARKGEQRASTSSVSVRIF